MVPLDSSGQGSARKGAEKGLLSIVDRLLERGMTTLEERRHQADMTMMFKVLKEGGGRERGRLVHHGI